MENQKKPEGKRQSPSTNNLISKCATYRDKILSYRRGTRISDRIPNVVVEDKVLHNKQGQKYIGSSSPYSNKDKSLEFFNDQVLQAATKIADDFDNSIERFQRYSDFLKLQLSDLTGDAETFHRISGSFEKKKKDNIEVENWKDEVTTILEEMQRQQELLDQLYLKNVKQPDPCEVLNLDYSQEVSSGIVKPLSADISPLQCPDWRKNPLGYIYCVWNS